MSQVDIDKHLSVKVTPTRTGNRVVIRLESQYLPLTVDQANTLLSLSIRKDLGMLPTKTENKVPQKRKAVPPVVQ
jgi:hypothetical protein